MMDAGLERLLQSIDPAVTLDVVSVRGNQAVNSFQVESGIIQKWEEFKEVLMDFYCHVQNTVLKIQLPGLRNPNIEWGQCCKMLIREYGHSGDKAAFEKARTGFEGGLYSVLKAISRQMINDYVNNEIRAKVSKFWNPLSTSEKFAVMEEYLGRYGNLLPSELTEKGAARIKADFVKVLEEHPRMIRRLRNVARRL